MKSVDVPDIEGLIGQAEIDRVFAVPPAAPDPFAGENHAPGPPPFDFTWSNWCAMEREHRAPSWSFCRFAIRVDGKEDIAQVFGMTRNGIGIFTTNFYVCHPFHAPMALWSVTHLRSGMGIGLFLHKSDAIMAGDILAKARSIDFAVDEMYRSGCMSSCIEAWFSGSIIPASIHAHQGDSADGVPLTIWFYNEEDAMTGKPEKLS